jgi:hypothetical protein
VAWVNEPERELIKTVRKKIVSKPLTASGVGGPTQLVGRLGSGHAASPRSPSDHNPPVSQWPGGLASGARRRRARARCSTFKWAVIGKLLWSAWHQWSLVERCAHPPEPKLTEAVTRLDDCADPVSMSPPDKSPGSGRRTLRLASREATVRMAPLVVANYTFGRGPCMKALA